MKRYSWLERDLAEWVKRIYVLVMLLGAAVLLSFAPKGYAQQQKKADEKSKSESYIEFRGKRYVLEPSKLQPNRNVNAKAQYSPHAVNINTASAAEIAGKLKGIGKKKAGLIVQWRQRHGRFTRLEQLLEVKGVGPATLKKNRRFLIL